MSGTPAQQKKLAAWREAKIAEWTQDPTGSLRRKHKTRASLDGWISRQCAVALAKLVARGPTPSAAICANTDGRCERRTNALVHAHSLYPP